MSLPIIVLHAIGIERSVGLVLVTICRDDEDEHEALPNLVYETLEGRNCMSADLSRLPCHSGHGQSDSSSRETAITRSEWGGFANRQRLLPPAIAK